MVSLQSVLNQDGSARYKDTFLNVSIKDEKPKLLYCFAMGQDGAGFYDEAGEQLVYRNKDKVDIGIVMPHAQWKQFGAHTILILRQPARQWKRSLSRGTHSLVCDHQVTKFTKDEKASAANTPWPSLRQGDVGALSKLLSEEGVSFTEGVNKLKECASVALKGNFMLTKQGRLYVSNTQIARVHLEQNSYSVVPLFQEELRDLTRGCGMKEVIKDAVD